MRIYQRGGSWYVDFTYNGYRTRKKIGSKRDAEDVLAAVKTDILRGEYRFQKSKKKKFEVYADEYLEYAKVHHRALRRTEIILNHLKEHFSGKQLSRITVKDIVDYKLKRLKKVKPPTVNRELSQLKHMFNRAKILKEVTENPVREVKFLQERQLAIHTLNKEEAKRLIDAAKGNMKHMIIIALNSGMRRGEILNLRWNDIDFEEHYIYIKETKSGVTRKIPMSPLVEKTLLSIERKFEYILQNPRTKKEAWDIRVPWRKACKKAKIHDLRFHDLRHTAATWMVAQGIDLVTVKEILGHANIKTTMRYAHPTPENKVKAVNALAGMLDEKSWHTQGTKEKSQVESALISAN